MAEKLVVIGAGMASGRVVEHLVEAAPDRFEITLFGAEPRGSYNRILLSPVLAGEKEFAEIVTHDAAWYAAHGISTRFGETVTRIDRAARQVRSRSGATPYDRLLIATGSAPFMPLLARPRPARGASLSRPRRCRGDGRGAATPVRTRGRHRWRPARAWRRRGSAPATWTSPCCT